MKILIGICIFGFAVLLYFTVAAWWFNRTR